MPLLKPELLIVSMLEVEKEYFNPADFTFHGIYTLQFTNKNFLRKRIKYPSIGLQKNGKILECPLSGIDGSSIEIITIPPRNTEILRLKVVQKNPPFTDIGVFSYYLSYFKPGLKTPSRKQILLNQAVIK